MRASEPGHRALAASVLLPGLVAAPGSSGIMRRNSSILFLFLIAALLLSAFPLFAESTNTPAMPPWENDDFNPGLLIIVMVMLVVWMLLLGLGLAAGIIVAALAGALTAFGILSSSVAVGLPSCVGRTDRLRPCVR